MDLRLPALEDGLQLIREAGPREATAIVVLSGWPRDLEARPEAKWVNCVFVKPVWPATLLCAIKELTARAAAGLRRTGGVGTRTGPLPAAIMDAAHGASSPLGTRLHRVCCAVAL